jgi:hypothetical protein
MWINVALETKEAAFGPKQQMTFHGTVRLVTGSTSLDPQRRMFVYPRSALFCMATNANLEINLFQLRGVQRSMRTVAIRTLHKALGNTVMRG